MDYRKIIASKLNIEGISSEEIEGSIITTPDSSKGDYALPCFKFAKIMHKAPNLIAEELSKTYPLDENIVNVMAVNGYLNFYINRNGAATSVIKKVLEDKENYGNSLEGNGKTICIDYSSINIAKSFHIGHLSTTVIGGALYRIYRKLGFNVVGINHLGDYGTQFGKLIYAYKTWGSKEGIEKDGVKELTRIYVKYHQEAENNPKLDDEARKYFKLIENGDKECNELFNWFKDITLKEAQKVYDALDIHFDSYNGESFYNDKMEPIVKELEEKGLLKESDGAKIVDLEEYNMPPCLILRSDGASLYATRDLAAATYRKNTYDFYKCLYVVAYQQNLHFKQVFKVLELMGKPWAKDLIHVAFGMVSLEEGTMSTRKGNVVLLEDVINKCNEKALEIISEKNPNLENKEEVAKMVGTGAVIFGALSNNKIKDIVFSYKKVLSFEGETGPYIQYTNARVNSLLIKGGEIKEYKYDNLLPIEYDLAIMLDKYPEVIKQAAEKYEPSIVTRYALDVAALFNKFYFDCKILQEEDNTKYFRLSLAKATGIVIENALGLLGIKCPKVM